jgi:hypothetical protein
LNELGFHEFVQSPLQSRKKKPGAKEEEEEEANIYIH